MDSVVTSLAKVTPANPKDKEVVQGDGLTMFRWPSCHLLQVDREA